MIRARDCLPLQRLHDLLLDGLIVIVEDTLRPQLTAILEIPRRCCCVDLNAGRDGELDGGGADA